MQKIPNIAQKTSSMINQKGKSSNTTSNKNNQKIEQINGKTNFIETLAGQKISGPKISVVKR